MQVIKQTIHNRNAYVTAPRRRGHHRTLGSLSCHGADLAMHGNAWPALCSYPSHSLMRAWQLAGIVLSFLAPSPGLRRPLHGYMRACTESKLPTVAPAAQFCLERLARLSGKSMRKFPPTLAELEALQAHRSLLVKVYYPAGFSVDYNVLPVESVETAHDAVEKLTRRVGLTRPDLMGLYTVCGSHGARACRQRFVGRPSAQRRLTRPSVRPGRQRD